MKIVMFVFSLLLFGASFLVGGLYFSGIFVASTVFFAGAGIVEAIERQTKNQAAINEEWKRAKSAEWQHRQQVAKTVPPAMGSSQRT